MTDFSTAYRGRPPKAKLRLMDTKMLASALEVIGKEGVPGLAVYCRSRRLPARGLIVRRMPDTASAAAHELFAVLRELDAAGATLIWVEQPPADAVRRATSAQNDCPSCPLS